MYRRLYFFLLLFSPVLSGLMLAACSETPEASAAEIKIEPTATAVLIYADGVLNGDLENGKTIYIQRCQGCHGEDGRDENFGDRETPIWIGTSVNEAPMRFFKIINMGDRERKMPRYENKLSKQDLMDVLAYSQILPVE